MATKIVKQGSTTHRATCTDCGTVFTYERSDVHRNYVRGGEWVACPCCGENVMHLGAGWRSPRPSCLA